VVGGVKDVVDEGFVEVTAVVVGVAKSERAEVVVEVAAGIGEEGARDGELV